MDRQFDSADASSNFLDETVNLETTHFKEGYDAGYSHGLDSGREVARQLGLKHGFEAGEELGFYKGCVDVWNSAIRVDPGCFSMRIKKSIKTMELLLEKYPLSNPENENIQEIMGGLRLKFRAICASLGMKLDYKGYPRSGEDKTMEF